VKTWKLQALLALFMALSAIALSAHATVHVDNGVEQCLLCASHADSRPAACGHMDWPVPERLETAQPASADIAMAPLALRLAPPARAPPAIS